MSSGKTVSLVRIPPWSGSIHDLPANKTGTPVDEGQFMIELVHKQIDDVIVGKYGVSIEFVGGTRLHFYSNQLGARALLEPPRPK